MAAMMREPGCVLLKRQGAEYVGKLTAGMSLQEQLAFWQRRTEIMRERQKQAHGIRGNPASWNYAEDFRHGRRIETLEINR